MYRDKHPLGIYYISRKRYSNQSAKILRKSTLDTIAGIDKLSWPPNVDELKSNDENCPDLLKLFYKTLLGIIAKTEKSVRIVNSLCSDVLYNISNGKYATLKHACLGLGIHSLTGMKTPIIQLHRPGHSISYDMVRRIETAQAELAQHLLNTSTILPLEPVAEGEQVISLAIITKH